MKTIPTTHNPSRNGTYRQTMIGLIILGLALISFIFICTPAWANDQFDCFDAKQCGDQSLSSSPACVRNKDYTITTTPEDSDVVVLSIHGGKIEPGTSEISQALANRYTWNRYDFNAHGRKNLCLLEGRDDFETLHITSTKFDDPDAIELVGRHSKSIAIHGAKNLPKERICVGGKNQDQIETFIQSVNRNKLNSSSRLHYSIKPIDVPRSKSDECTTSEGVKLKGTSRCNIVNRNTKYQGLQLELSHQMRKDLVNDNDPKNENLREVVYGAIKDAMDMNQAELSAKDFKDCDI